MAKYVVLQRTEDTWVKDGTAKVLAAGGEHTDLRQAVIESQRRNYVLGPNCCTRWRVESDDPAEMDDDFGGGVRYDVLMDKLGLDEAEALRLTE